MCNHKFELVDRFVPEREWIYIGHGWSIKSGVFEVVKCIECGEHKFESHVEEKVELRGPPGKLLNCT
jgi:hypothetical protein